ncbi:MAG TPA: RES family NAD+ phosphorylase [Candidatus Margulisiibacteriota bacterium]|nr:RES family NAD+ phosphorylase [Candidatus Margulisiibacteriota bacterium]
MSLTLWRSVRRAHAPTAFNGEGAARFPGRYNAAGVRAVYLADCPGGCALEIVAGYAAPEALATHVLFEVEVEAPLVDLRLPRTLARLGVTFSALTAPDDYEACRRVAERLRAERRPGAIVPAATVARAFNVVIYPDAWNEFVVHDPVPLALDNRLLRRLAAGE